MKKNILLLIISTAIFGSENSYETGRALYNDKACSNCHGTNAEGSGSYPKLANRSKNYLIKKLKQFQKGKSTSQAQEVMFGFARSLNETEMDYMTTYLSDYKKESADKYKLDYDIMGSVD
jgi:cytochrome c553